MALWTPASSTLILAASLGSLVLGCSMDDSQQIVDAALQGTINGSPWTAGTGAVSSSSDPASPVIVRIFEQGTPGDPCSIAPTTGRRVEVGMAAMQTGRYEPSTDAGYFVETWEGTKGERDAYAAIEIINAPKAKGGDFRGKVRFGSAGTDNAVEGSFAAIVCEDFP